MAKSLGTCEKCGQGFARVNRLRKLCTECQILRDMDYRKDWARECDVCGVEHYPVRLSYKMCDPCRDPVGDPEKYPECELCHTHKRPAPGTTRFCLSCVQADKQVRGRYLVSLRQKVNKRRIEWHEAGKPEVPQPPPPPRLEEPALF